MRAREIDDEQNPEPIPGLPAKLPEGEKILWQGSPGVVALAIHAFRARAITVYFAVIALWRCAAMASSGATTADILEVMSAIAMFFAVAMALIFTLAYLMKKETIYTITSRRVVLRFGVALRKTVTIPFRLIASASLRAHGEGYGDVALALTGPDRIAYLHLWPHARPLKFGKAEPTLRAIPDAARVAGVLAAAVEAAGTAIALTPAREAAPTLETPSLAPAAA
jgi:hypothetical protein